MSEQSPPEQQNRTTTQELMLLLLLRVKEQIHDLVSLYGQDYNAELFERRALIQLEMAHIEAAYHGRFQSGNIVPFNNNDRKHGQVALREQEKYFTKFIADVKAGVYDVKAEAEDASSTDNPDDTADSGGEEDAVDDDDDTSINSGVTDAMYARADLYGSAIIGTFNEMFTLYSPQGAMIWWITSTEPCSGCAELAVNSPYPVKEIPAVPGDGSTPCLSRCRCSLIRDDGVSALHF